MRLMTSPQILLESRFRTGKATHVRVFHRRIVRDVIRRAFLRLVPLREIRKKSFDGGFRTYLSSGGKNRIREFGFANDAYCILPFCRTFK